MKVYLVRKRVGINAIADYDEKTGRTIVLKESTVSSDIAYTEKFRGAKSIEKAREGIVFNNVLQKDIEFNSASTAANFVTGTSTNGLIAWRDVNGKTIKALLTEQE